ncbi:hypothetical protein B0H19DRAFT_1213787 [Mycena capillaripes]|nr:hypothetical protein B0H19DRAFT_1213787 [Mycena capillaripes]
MAPKSNLPSPRPKQAIPRGRKWAEATFASQKVNSSKPSYPFYYPHFDVNEKFPPLEIFEFTDAGRRADPAKPHLPAQNVIGVQISQLSSEGLDELALYAAERKVLIFRDQDFMDLGPARLRLRARHFGSLHKQPTAANVRGYPELTIALGDKSITGTSWHSDVSYEKQMPGTTFFLILDPPTPGAGRDTLFSFQVEAYKRLAPEFQKCLEVAHAEFSRKWGRPVRREPIESMHPVVRGHPVTGEKALYTEESEYLLNFLYDHIAKGADFQIRATSKPGTVIVWDNRLTVHSGTADMDRSVRRHAVRLTLQAEVPVAA